MQAMVGTRPGLTPATFTRRIESHLQETPRSSTPQSDSHSTLMLAARITLPHFSVSSASNLPKSAGEPGSTAVPKSANDALILGSARAALTSALSLATISAGVFLGAAMPYQPLAS